MPLDCGTQITQVSLRARDPNNNATGRADVRDLLSRMQTILNARLGSVIESASLTINANQQAYRISDVLTRACKIVGVRDSTRDLDPIPFEQLPWLDLQWFTAVGNMLTSYCLVGRDLLIVRPNLHVSQVVTVFYRPITSTLVTDTSLFQIPDEDVPLLLDPVEAMLDLKARDLPDVKPILERWAARIKAVMQERYGEKVMA